MSAAIASRDRQRNITRQAGLFYSRTAGHWWEAGFLALRLPEPFEPARLDLLCECGAPDGLPCDADDPADCPSLVEEWATPTVLDEYTRVARQTIRQHSTGREPAFISQPFYRNMNNWHGSVIYAKSASHQITVQARFVETAERWVSPDGWALAPAVKGVQSLVGLRKRQVVALIAGMAFPVPSDFDWGKLAPAAPAQEAVHA